MMTSYQHLKYTKADDEGSLSTFFAMVLASCFSSAFVTPAGVADVINLVTGAAFGVNARTAYEVILKLRIAIVLRR